MLQVESTIPIVLVHSIYIGLCRPIQLPVLSYGEFPRASVRRLTTSDPYSDQTLKTKLSFNKPSRPEMMAFSLCSLALGWKFRLVRCRNTHFVPTPTAPDTAQ